MNSTSFLEEKVFGGISAYSLDVIDVVPPIWILAQLRYNNSNEYYCSAVVIYPQQLLSSIECILPHISEPGEIYAQIGGNRYDILFLEINNKSDNVDDIYNDVGLITVSHLT